MYTTFKTDPYIFPDFLTTPFASYDKNAYKTEFCDSCRFYCLLIKKILISARCRYCCIPVQYNARYRFYCILSYFQLYFFWCIL